MAGSLTWQGSLTWLGSLTWQTCSLTWQVSLTLHGSLTWQGSLVDIYVRIQWHHKLWVGCERKDQRTCVVHCQGSASHNECSTLGFLVMYSSGNPTTPVETNINESWSSYSWRKVKLGAHAIKRVAAGAHLQTPWLFELAKRPDDRADYCLDCSFLA